MSWLVLKLQEKYEISPVGEGGEIETTVLSGPFFKKALEVTDSQIHWKGDSGWLDIKKAEMR